MPYGILIQCWNGTNGCDAVGPACQIVDHFDDCQYHAVSCFRCKQSMPYKELAGHLDTNNCIAAQASTASSSHGVPDATITLFAQAIRELQDKLSSVQICINETKELISGHVQGVTERATADTLVAESLQTLDNSIKENIGQNQVEACRTAKELALISNSISAVMDAVHSVEMLANEMKSSLGTSFAEDTRKISESSLNLQQKLDGFSAFSTKEFEKTGKSLEALQKTLKERENGEMVIKQSLNRLHERLNDGLCLNISLLGKAAKCVSGLPLCACEPLIWSVEKWSYLKIAATTNGQVTACAKKPHYFFGYFILPGIKMVYEDGSLKLFLIYHLYQGGYDSLLNWPFEEEVHLSILNGKGEETPLCIKQTGKGLAMNADQRPTTERNEFATCGVPLNVVDVEKNGCVINDMVSVKFAVSRL